MTISPAPSFQVDDSFLDDLDVMYEEAEKIYTAGIITFDPVLAE